MHGWQVVCEFVDEGVSASKESASARPEFRSLLSFVEEGSADVVMVHKLDRFSRNLSVTMQSMARIHAAGATFVSLTEHIDYTTPQGRMLLGLFALFAEFYSDNLATEVSKGRSQRAREGLWNGDLPFGYVSSGDARRAPVVVEAEASLVRGAFERYAAGRTTAHAVAGWLNEQGAVPRAKGERASGRFTKATVIDMLSNVFYTGVVTYRGESFAGQQAAIVSGELFERVARARNSQRKLSSAGHRVHAHSYLLRGLAKCVSCGSLLWCAPGTMGDRYRDASKLKQRACGAHKTSVYTKGVDAQVGQLFRRMVLPSNWQEVVAAGREEDAGEAERASKRASIRGRLSRLQDVYMDGDMPRGKYQGERARLMSMLAALDAEAVAAERRVESGELLKGLARLWDVATEEERCRLVGLVLSEVWVDLDAGEVAYVTPNVEFAQLFSAMRAERVVSGDPERIRVNHAQLYAPVMALVEMGVVYRPDELAS